MHSLHASASPTTTTSTTTTTTNTAAVRVRLPRVRTGCVACKTAHVKCDEAKPACKRCLRATRPCNYPPPPCPKHKSHNVSFPRALGVARKPLRPLLPALVSSSSPFQNSVQNSDQNSDRSSDTTSSDVAPTSTAVVTLIRSPQPLSDLDDPNAALYFDRFRAQAALYRSATGDSDDFWCRTLLRETASDKGVLAAVLSIGALAQACGNVTDHVSLFSVNYPGPPNTQKTSYRDALKYYSLSISRLRQRLGHSTLLHDEPSAQDTTPVKQDSSRAVLISSILYSAFELMHGHAESADRIVAKSMSMLRRKILPKTQSALPPVQNLALHDDKSPTAPPDTDLPYTQIGRSCDDDGTEEAEWLLVRRAVLGVLYAPLLPSGREAIFQLPNLDFLSGPAPPPVDASSMTFCKLYFRWLPLAALWYVRALSVQMPLSNCAFSPGSQQDYARMRARLLKEEPWSTLEAERQKLKAQMLAWEDAVDAKLKTSLTVEEATIVAQILPNCKNLRYQIMALFNSNTDPMERAEMRALGHEVMSMSEKALATLSGISDGRDEMRESLTSIAILMSQNCRESADTRRRAFKLCRQLIDSHSHWVAKGVVMGISTLIDMEEEGCDKVEDMVPVSSQWQWTHAKWNDNFTMLEVVYSSKAMTMLRGSGRELTGDVVPMERRMTLKAADFGY